MCLLGLSLHQSCSILQRSIMHLCAGFWQKNKFKWMSRGLLSCCKASSSKETSQNCSRCFNTTWNVSFQSLMPLLPAANMDKLSGFPVDTRWKLITPSATSAQEPLDSFTSVHQLPIQIYFPHSKNRTTVKSVIDLNSKATWRVHLGLDSFRTKISLWRST